MNLTLTLSEQEAAELERRATAAGTDVRTFLLHVVNDLGETDEQFSGELPYDQWKQDFQQWLQGHRTRNGHMDERARLVRGTIVISSAPGSGVTIEVQVPLPEDAA